VSAGPKKDAASGQRVKGLIDLHPHCSPPLPLPMPRKDNANTPATAQAQQDAVSEGIENFELPRALVTRIAKSAVRSVPSCAQR